MEYRTKADLKFEADGPEKPGPVETFQLVRETIHQSRRSDREAWRQHTSPGKPGYNREVLADGLTRGQVARLIADGADWLSYIETEGTA